MKDFLTAVRVRLCQYRQAYGHRVDYFVMLTGYRLTFLLHRQTISFVSPLQQAGRARVWKVAAQWLKCRVAHERNVSAVETLRRQPNKC